ncbi:MAG: 3-hydroxyacyl-CoA dehydrogenase NAD-binding domain-containing protein, partial [Alphaproteobacteria bacterium]|nr:3-hydroxyacyl-CoA dehydrogenase NAD-binding domain-containing protein [Alphaproteobacteria bacterium]
MDIKQVAVIGSGVMGSQIAAHITNAGVPVLLLDIVPKDATDRNVLAKGALEKLQKAEPSTFMH